MNENERPKPTKEDMRMMGRVATLVLVALFLFTTAFIYLAG